MAKEESVDIETKGYELGIVVGLERGAKAVEDVALLAFKHGHDENAKDLRILRDCILNRATAQREAYDKKYPK